MKRAGRVSPKHPAGKMETSMSLSSNASLSARPNNASRHVLERRCELCSAPFLAVRTHQRFCSRQCMERAHAAKKRRAEKEVSKRFQGIARDLDDSLESSIVAAGLAVPRDVASTMLEMCLANPEPLKVWEELMAISPF